MMAKEEKNKSGFNGPTVGTVHGKKTTVKKNKNGTISIHKGKK